MEERIAQAIRAAAETMGADDAAFRMERPKDPTHGDWASNVALALASRLRRPPRQIAEELAERLGTLNGVDRVEVAGPGFFNFRSGRFEPAVAGRDAPLRRRPPSQGAGERPGRVRRSLDEFYPETRLYEDGRVADTIRALDETGLAYTTLAELVAETGVDVARYFFLMRRPEVHLTFDLDVALDQSDQNPVYKVQYAHARLCRLRL